MDRILVSSRRRGDSWKKEDPNGRRPNSLMSASFCDPVGAALSLKTGLSNPCPVEVLRHWRSTRGKSSPSCSEVLDLTLNEIVSVLHKRQNPGSRSALSRFFARHGITI